MYNKVCFIVNPSSGLGYSLPLVNFLKATIESKNIKTETFTTSKKEDFGEILMRNKWENTLIAVVGGDGSFNEVINFIIFNNIEIPFLPIPAGTSNVYNFAIGVNIFKIAGKIASYNLTPKRYKVGEVEYENGKKRYFFSMCGIGFDAYIVNKLAKGREKRLYFWEYLTTTIGEVILKRFPHQRFRLHIDNNILDDIFFAICFNIKAYGGPFKFSKEKGGYNEDFLYLVNLCQKGIGSIPSIYGQSLLTHFLGSGNFPHTEFMELYAETIQPNTKVFVHIDGDPLTTLPIIVRKSEKYITVYS